MSKFSGYKTYVSAIIIGVSALLEALGKPEIAKVVLTIGGALGLASLRHAVKKADK